MAGELGVNPSAVGHLGDDAVAQTNDMRRPWRKLPKGLANATPILNGVFLTRHYLDGELTIAGISKIADAAFQLRFRRGE